MQAARTLVKYAMDMSKYPCRRRGIIISNERREIMSEPGIGQVQFRSDGYWHVGVYIGNGLVIHFVANEKGSSALTGPGCVKIDRLEDIAQLYDVTGPPQFMPPALAFTAVVLTWAVLAEYVDSPDPKRRPNDPGAPPRHDLDRLQWSDLSVWCDGFQAGSLKSPNFFWRIQEHGDHTTWPHTTARILHTSASTANLPRRPIRPKVSSKWLLWVQVRFTSCTLRLLSPVSCSTAERS